MTLFQIYGSSSDPDLFFCEAVAKKIAAKVAERTETKSAEDIQIEFHLETEIDFLIRLEALKKTFEGSLFPYSETHIVLRDSNILGSISAFIRVAVTEFGVEDADYANNLLFNRLVKEETARLLRSTGRKYVQIEFQDGSAKRNSKSPQYGKIVIELFDHLCPFGCENFMLLCVGEQGMDEKYNVPLHYFNCPIHRIVKGGWFQCGDIVDGSGAHSLAALRTFSSTPPVPSLSSFSVSSLSPTPSLQPFTDESDAISDSPKQEASSIKVPDECFSVDFGFPLGGIVGYANTGPHTNGSQFFITLGSCEWMNHKFEGFGRVVFGNSVLKLIDSASTLNQRPSPPIRIVNCGGIEL